MSTTARHNQQIIEWNQTATAYPRTRTVHGLFEDWAVETPRAIALEYGGDILTYAQLNERANRLARFLCERGVGPEVRVGLLMDRRPEMVVALLGILKAGGAYVPLDLDYPSSRIAFMLEDSQAPVLLTISNLSERLPDYAGERVCLDRDWAQIEMGSAQNPDIAPDAENLAYVIYTSGSTGTPKGVEIQHRAIVRLVRNTDYYQVDAADRILQASNVSFDAATFELWGALLNGARLVGIDKDRFLNSKALAAFLRKKEITAMFATTAVFNQVAREDPGAFSGLRALMFGGEAADCGAVREVLAHHPPERLLHVYGPTESTTFASWYQVETVAADATTVPIGRPLANTTLYVLDQQMRPQPVGVPGELYIGGEGLARGYLNREALTAERFVANPFDSQSRLYRTGDKVRYRDDGAIDFIGRFDNQVKLRGFRIELGEVEAALRSHEGISDAVVTLQQGSSGEEQIVAHVVIDYGRQQKASRQIPDLREYLAQKLPDFMVPAAFVPMDALPLTPNGKVDRKALPQPSINRSLLSTDYEKPRDDEEEKLVAIWADVLGLEQVGINDQFMDLGGHSLLATRIVTRIREVFGLDLTLADFYRDLTVSGLAARINNAGATRHSEGMPVICLASRDKPLPVSFPQEQVIFLTQLSPESMAYNTQMSIRFVGKLDVPALEKALNEILRRHEIFRTSFDVVDGLAFQRIHPEWTLRLPVVDLQGLPKQQRGERLDEVVDEEIHQRFKISEIPLVRWKLVKIKPDEHLLLHVEHHLVHDGWSFGVFIHELRVLYEAYCNGRESPLPELPIQFADYVMWQRQRLRGELLESSLRYWKKVLAAPLPMLQLPTDYQRPPIQSHRGAEEVIDLSPELSDQLRELSQREHSTLYITALTVFLVLLHKYSRQQDIVIGTGVANRNLSEVEGLIGMIINTIALRADLSGDPKFHELVSRIHDMAFEAYEYQELPFEKLVEELQINRDLAYNPVFQILFGFHDSQVPAFEVSNLSGRINYLHNGSAKFDLNLVVIPWAEQQTGINGDVQDRRITMKWEYATDLFTPATIQGMTRHYLNLVQELIRFPDKPLSELSMLTESERLLLVEEWNQTSTDYPADKTVHEIFEMQAAATPDTIAVDYQGTTLSYAELNQRANQLAHYLQSRGVGPEVMVGLYLERSLEMIVGLLGILKAGGAYVPLDLDYPQPRIAFMLEDAQVPVLLTMSSLKNQLPVFDGEQVCLDTEWATIEKESAVNPEVASTADTLAYVIYTSGSTGTPKGVEIQHRAINRLVCHTDYYQVDATDRIVQASNVSFDAATFEIWGALLNGAQLIGIKREELLNSKSLAAFLQQQGISAMFLTTALFNQIAREVPDAFRGLRGLMFGGEAVEPGAVRQVLTHSPPEHLLHVYGPTESTTFASWHRVTEVTEAATTIPIGHPLANTTLYILDQNLHPVPIGVPGELYIGGDGLARGYLNQPEITAEKFVANPFITEPGARLYRTGDLVRSREDGAVEFMGRIDHQVKLRGFRIELGEIEALLSQHDEVKDAVVIVREDEPGDKRLVAYVLVEQDSPLTPGTLGQHVRSTLPGYMVPSAFVLLAALPLTPNGKVDRTALPLPDDVRASLGAEYTAPRTELEARMAQIWCVVLKLERVGVHDNFFDLGGHSLLATQVMSRVRDNFQVEMSVAELFATPILADFVEKMEMIRWANEKLPDDENGDRKEFRL